MNEVARADLWRTLRTLTPARIALGRTGSALTTAEVLRFGLAHARARDAVHVALDVAPLQRDLAAAGFDSLCVRSAAADRVQYLLRPDLGRRLAEDGREALQSAAAASVDVCVVLADGLSAAAVQRHAVPVLDAFRALAQDRWTLAPVVIAEQARVALGDEIGACLHARLVAVLIGERPGLSAPDSLGIYLTHDPRVGRTDAERNCISNVRPEGLTYADAARRMAWLVQEALRRQLTGVGLKDETAPRRLEGNAALEESGLA
jgi:ethanolamine ammonia-lyase small subunit